MHLLTPSPRLPLYGRQQEATTSEKTTKILNKHYNAYFNANRLTNECYTLQSPHSYTKKVESSRVHN